MGININTPNIPPGTMVDELIGHEIVGATRSTRRFSRSAVLASLSELQAGGGVVFSAKSEADAHLEYDEFQVASVIGDPDAANNGIYQKIGASGAGNWSRVSDLPEAIIRLTVTGGTADAITATMSPYEPSNVTDKLYLIVPTANNSGAVTINGVPVKNALNSSLTENNLIAGSPVALIRSADSYQLLVSLPADTAGVVADAISARDAAGDYAANAASSASALGNQVHQYDTLALAKAASIPYGPTGVQAIKVTREAAGTPVYNAIYVQGTSAGPRAFRDNNGTGNWWQLDLSNGIDRHWWGALSDGTSGSATADAASENALLALPGISTNAGMPIFYGIEKPYYSNFGFNTDGLGSQFVGVGPYQTEVTFAPASSATLFSFELASSDVGLEFGRVSNLMALAGSANATAVIDAKNTSHFVAEDLYVNGAAPSFANGVVYRGREFGYFSRFLLYASGTPFNGLLNPHRDFGTGLTIDYDLLTVNNGVMVPLQATGTAMKWADGASVTNVDISQVSLALGANGWTWDDTLSDAPSASIGVRLTRREQSQNASGWFVRWARSGARDVYCVRYDLCAVGSGRGLYKRKVQRLTIANHFHQPDTIPLDVDATVDGLNLENCYWPPGGTAAPNMAGQILTRGNGVRNGSKLPSNAHYHNSTFNAAEYRGTPGAGAKQAVDPVVETFSLANGATVSPAWIVDFPVPVPAEIRLLISSATGTVLEFAHVLMAGGLAVKLGDSTSNIEVRNDATAIGAGHFGVRWSGSVLTYANSTGSTVFVRQDVILQK